MSGITTGDVLIFVGDLILISVLAGSLVNLHGLHGLAKERPKLRVNGRWLSSVAQERRDALISGIFLIGHIVFCLLT